MPPDILNDVVINILGLLAVSAYLAKLHLSRQLSSLEYRLTFLFWNLWFLMMGRCFFWSLGAPDGLQRLIFIPVILLPIGSIIITEGLLRRHAPLWLKCYGLAGFLLFFTTNIFVGFDRTLLVCLLGFMVSVFFVNLIQIAFRQRDSLSASENHFASVFAIGGLAATLLAVSDFRLEIGYFPIRMGAVGIMLLIYATIREQQGLEGRFALIKSILRLLGRSAAFAVVIHLIGRETSEFFPSLLVVHFTFALSLVLLFAIFDQLHAVTRKRRHNSLQRWLCEVPDDAAAVFSSLNQLDHLEGHRILTAKELMAYDITTLTNYLARRSVVSAAELKKFRREGHAAQDQILDLLGNNHMTHICLLSREPVIFLVCRLPEVNLSSFGRLELHVVTRVLQLALGSNKQRVPL